MVLIGERNVYMKFLSVIETVVVYKEQMSSVSRKFSSNLVSREKRGTPFVFGKAHVCRCFISRG